MFVLDVDVVRSLLGAVAGVVDHVFTQRGLHRLSAECDARNAPSAALLRRVGFRQEGLRREHTWIKGEWTDDLLFGLLCADWSPFPPSRGRSQL
jgi:RimJ/RimL family protein N-acetyltransferase